MPILSWWMAAMVAGVVVTALGLWAEGAVPVLYLRRMSWSVLLVSLLTFPLGILFAYRRP